MDKPAAPQTVHQRNKRKRLVGWIFFYILLVGGFVYLFYSQASRVNTLQFDSGQLQLTTSKVTYTVGDSVGYTIKNNLGHAISFENACPQEPLYVYSWENNAWVRIHDTAAMSACANPAKQTTIQPGASYDASFDNWPNLFKKPGIYRIAVLATNYTAIPYADFLVEAKPVAPQTKTQIIIQKVITPIYIQVPTAGGGGGGGDD